MITFVLIWLGSLALPAEVKTTPSTRPQWVDEWKQIRKLSFQNRTQACEKFKALTWTAEFPHQDLVSFKRAEYCRTAPPLNPKKFESLMELARFHRDDFRYEKALPLLNKAFQRARTLDQRLECLDEQLKIHRSRQDRKMRLKTLQKMARLNPEKYTVEYARALWTFDQTKKAQSVLHRADKKWKKAISRQGVFYIQGRILEEQKKPDQALQFYEKALLQPDAEADLNSQLLSSVAWWQFKKENFERSALLWQSLAEKSKDRFTQTRAQYWQAKSLLRLAKPETEKAQSLLRTIIQDDPLSYYSVLAHRDLGEKFKPVKAFKGPAQDLKEISWFKTEDADKFQWALAFDEKTFLDSLLNSYLPNFLKASRQEQRILLENYWTASLTNSIVRLLSLIPAEKRVDFFNDHQNLLFPSKYENEIQKLSELEKMDASFVLSLIRQESGFNPMARSPTDALGLMQLMPALARKLAVEAGVQLQEETQLFDPDLNLKLGIRELKNRLQEFGGSAVLAAASYNAGSDAVKSWIKTRYRPNLVEFIEEIPYEETRSYVRLILRNQVFYKRLLETKPFLFPDSTLADISPAPR